MTIKDLSISIVMPLNKKQSGAVEACWAHNPEVRRSKLRSAKCFFQKLKIHFTLAQNIYPFVLEVKIFHINLTLSGWPSGLRRQTQGEYLTLMIGSCIENSGPRMRAWVQIPLLTNQFFLIIVTGRSSGVSPINRIHTAHALHTY